MQGASVGKLIRMGRQKEAACRNCKGHTACIDVRSPIPPIHAVQCGEALAQLRQQRLTHDHIETLGTQLVDLHGELDTLQRALVDAHADPLSIVPPPVLAAALAAELPRRACDILCIQMTSCLHDRQCDRRLARFWRVTEKFC